ncbi:MAG: Na+/H+ antiporter subunit E [Clostridiales bacterium]|nr:Na+/H+ antiporter subunit E [Clostridiales bacterium]
MKNINFLIKKKVLALILVLIMFWILLSPALTIQSIMIGIVVVIGVVFLNKGILEEEGSFNLSLKLIRNFIVFIFHLIKEIIKANIDVAKIVLSPSMPVSPAFIKLPIKFKSEVNKVIYANAVTLTPGTLTVDMSGNNYIIHVLTTSAGEDLKDGILEQTVLKLEEEND